MKRGMRVLFASIITIVSSFTFAQGKISLEECEAAFIQNNLLLLAQQYNIGQADADIIQAKIWELPEAGYQGNLINPEDRRILDVGRSNSLSIQQLIYLGGKKKHEVEYAKRNKDLALLQFEQLLAELRTQLYETYYTLHFEEKKVGDIDTQLIYMTDLLSAFKIQTAKGNTSLKEQVRLQSMVVQLNNDKMEVVNNILQQQQQLKILTGLHQNISTSLSNEEANKLLAQKPLFNLEEIKQEALANNSDYLYSLKDIEANKLNLSWQKAQNIPDISVGGQWNQLGGAFKNEVDFTVAIPIPLWKRNKGNVVKAQYQIKEAETNNNLKKLTLESAVEMAYRTWQNQYQQYFTVKGEDLENLNTVYNGMTDNFRKGNVTLVDFTDFMDSYRQTILQLYEMRKQVMIAGQELIRLTQSKIF